MQIQSAQKQELAKLRSGCGKHDVGFHETTGYFPLDNYFSTSIDYIFFNYKTFNIHTSSMATTSLSLPVSGTNEGGAVFAALEASRVNNTFGTAMSGISLIAPFTNFFQVHADLQIVLPTVPSGAMEHSLPPDSMIKALCRYMGADKGGAGENALQSRRVLKSFSHPMSTKVTVTCSNVTLQIGDVASFYGTNHVWPVHRDLPVAEVLQLVAQIAAGAKSTGIVVHVPCTALMGGQPVVALKMPPLTVCKEQLFEITDESLKDEILKEGEVTRNVKRELEITAGNQKTYDQVHNDILAATALLRSDEYDGLEMSCDDLQKNKIGSC